MMDSFILFLKQQGCFEEYKTFMFKRHKSFGWIRKNLKPEYWVNSVFLWGTTSKCKWGKVHQKWLKELEEVSWK